jgi:hypothetical protein
MDGWKMTLRSTERTALRLPRRELVVAADREGVVAISAPRLARLAGVSRKTAWGWLRGYPVSPEVDAAFLAALKLDAA